MGANEKVLSVQLAMTPELAAELQRDQGALEVAQAYVIDSPEMAREANKELANVKARITRLKEAKALFVAPAKQIITNAEGFFDPAMVALQSAEKFLKDALLRFQEAEERRLEDARRQREAEERAARQKAEQEAAAARARAEEQAAAARKAAQEAEEKRLAAEREGNARAAAAAAAEKAKQEARAESAIENGEAKAQQAQLAAAAMPDPQPAPAPTALEGFSSRTTWSAELTHTEPESLALVVSAITGVEVRDFKRADLLALLKLDMPRANKIASGLQKAMNIPGLRAVPKKTAASRAA